MKCWNLKAHILFFLLHAYNVFFFTTLSPIYHKSIKHFVIFTERRFKCFSVLWFWECFLCRHFKMNMFFIFSKTSTKRKNFGRLLKTGRLNMMLNIIYLLEYWKALNIFRVIEFIWNICEIFNSFESCLGWPCNIVRYYYLWRVFAFYISFWLVLVKSIEIGYFSSR